MGRVTHPHQMRGSLLMGWRQRYAWMDYGREIVGPFFVTCLILFILVMLATSALPAERCRASYYGTESGTRTANGERFRPNGLSIALPFTPHNERYRVCLRGRCIIVRHNDFGPARYTHRCADLSRGGARALGFERAGTALVEIERLR